MKNIVLNLLAVILIDAVSAQVPAINRKQPPVKFGFSLSIDYGNVIMKNADGKSSTDSMISSQKLIMSGRPSVSFGFRCTKSSDDERWSYQAGVQFTSIGYMTRTVLPPNASGKKEFRTINNLNYVEIPMMLNRELQSGGRHFNLGFGLSFSYLSDYYIATYTTYEAKARERTTAPAGTKSGRINFFPILSAGIQKELKRETIYRINAEFRIAAMAVTTDYNERINLLPWTLGIRNSFYW